MITAQLPTLLDDAHREDWLAFESDPGPLVFLVGCQRSGTSWLHLQLARSGAFRYLSAYDVYSSERLIHNHRRGLAAFERRRFADLLTGAPPDRGIDTIPADPATPEEYGLIVSDSRFRYDRPDTTATSLPRLRELCAKKALMEGRGLPLLLKSPPDYPAAINLLAATWPRARFVAIQRHPLHTLDSQARAWRQMVTRKNEYLALIDRGYRELFNDDAERIKLGFFLHSEAGVAWLADCILRAHIGFLEVCGSWPSNRMLTVRYEDLCGDQAAEFARISAFLGITLPPPSAPPAPRSSRIGDDVRRAFSARVGLFRPFLDRHNYTAEAA
jgi:hypothetical protein